MKYSEKELIDFTNECIHKRFRKYKDYEYESVNDAELQNWKETIKQERREEKINELLK